MPKGWGWLEVLVGFAEILGALGTVGAFGVSLWLLYTTIADRRADMLREAARTEAVKRSQSTRVHVVTPILERQRTRQLPHLQESDPHELEGEYLVAVEVRNDSDQPIYRVHVDFEFLESGEPLPQVTTPPRDTNLNGELLPQFDLMPGTSERFRFGLSARGQITELEALERAGMVGTITYRDASGYMWFRDSTSILTELKSLSTNES